MKSHRKCGRRLGTVLVLTAVMMVAMFALLALAADVARQIVEGVNAADLEHIGGKPELGPDGTLELNGDTGISAGMKDELASIRGQPQIIPLFDSVTSPGNNAMYTIVGFAGVRVMDVKLTGKMSGERVIIQPARVQVYGGIPASDGTQTSYFLYSPVWLVC